MELEKTVAQAAAKLFDTPLSLIQTVRLDLRPDDTARLGAGCSGLAERIRKREPNLLRQLINAVHIKSEEMRIILCTSTVAKVLALSQSADAPPTIEISTAVRLQRSGMAMRLIQ